MLRRRAWSLAPEISGQFGRSRPDAAGSGQQTRAGGDFLLESKRAAARWRDGAARWLRRRGGCGGAVAAAARWLRRRGGCGGAVAG
jgi:hypothetical protein